jgi:hypothetical protein
VHHFAPECRSSKLRVSLKVAKALLRRTHSREGGAKGGMRTLQHQSYVDAAECRWQPLGRLRSCLSAKAQLGVCQQNDNKFDKSDAADGYESFTSGLDQQAV